MPRMPTSPDSALTRTAHRILLGVVVLVCLALLILWRTDNPRLERVRMALIDRAAPSMAFVNGPIDLGSHLVRDYREFIDVYDQNRALRREIQALRGWRERARVLEEENAQLRALSHVKLPPRTTFVAGDVIADSGGPFREAVIVNVGRADQIEDGAAAVDGSGLVGRVVGVGERASRLMLLTDFSSRVPVVIKSGGQRAMLAGDGTPSPKLEFIDGGDRMQAGALVETSGDGGVFPPDLPVGHVALTPGGTWRVTLLADYARLEFVRLLRYRPDTRIDGPGGLVRPHDAGPRAGEPSLAGAASN